MRPSALASVPSFDYSLLSLTVVCGCRQLLLGTSPHTQQHAQLEGFKMNKVQAMLADVGRPGAKLLVIVAAEAFAACHVCLSEKLGLYHIMECVGQH